MAKVLELDDASFVFYECRSAAGFTKSQGCLGQADEAVELGDDPDGCQPSGVLLVETCEETPRNLLDDLAMSFLCFLQLPYKTPKLRAIVALDFRRCGHLIPVLRYSLDFDGYLQLVDFLTVVPVDDSV